ncbi:hypothetical protein EJV47_05505 [Hymenobacter gummosus]|uniref:Glycosyltransferase RgtA/B/C/D-like domain-containing protein n=1 Tax=Hymenobacter gummosus TaxID=1776032 RepID=A0A3S0HBR1_9BACT|nr:DUF6044 family protein [Hymenobacter gummosus]RTQ52468.1 hypothetical protein EJV47_05505 [Hymenobacter gummosus]
MSAPSFPPFSRRPLLWALLALLLLWLPILLRGPDSYVILDDNLDAEVSVPVLLHRFGVALDYRLETTIPAIMNGLPRSAQRPGLNATVGLFDLLPPLAAYWTNDLLVRLAALLGLYLLLRRYGLGRPADRALAAGVALAWAVLPAHSMYGLSALGLPWPVLAVLNLRAGRGRWWDWLTLLLFPLWSMLVLAGFFLLAALGLLLLLDGLRRRRVAWAAWGGVGVLALGYLVVEWPLISSTLLRPQFVPHRVEFRLAELTPKGLKAGLLSAWQYFVWGQYHASRFFRGLILLTLVVAAGWRWRRGETDKRWEARVLRALLGLGLLAVFCGFYPQLMGPVQRLAPSLGAFNLSRFHFLTPLLWFGLWVLALRELPAGPLRTGLVALQLLLGLALNPEWSQNLRRWAGRPAAHEPSWQQFLAPELLTRVRHTLEQRSGQPAAQWRVACLGLPPAVAQLSGFYTLDSYQSTYPLSYKHQFRPLIAGELAKSPELQRYFDDWGSRCYLFSAELGRNFRVARTDSLVVQHWRFDAAAFRRLGGRYVLSAARLARPAEAGLRPVGYCTEPAAYWGLYIYELID